jgi:hypothetical protein
MGRLNLTELKILKRIITDNYETTSDESIAAMATNWGIPCDRNKVCTHRSRLGLVRDGQVVKPANIEDNKMMQAFSLKSLI